MREAGILLPITALPSKYGIGCFSKEAYEFVDWLSEAHQSYWQILPLGPTGFGDSPYQAFSTYAGNPYFIDFEKLIDEGLIEDKECDSIDFGEDDEYIDYKKIYDNRFEILKKAFAKSKHNDDVEYTEFIWRNAGWIEDYALFMALKEKFDNKPWYEWDKDIRTRQKSVMESLKEELQPQTDFWKFVQYKFYTQWNRLKKYANEKGIKIIGDIPIYVSADSADVWSSPELFELDEDRKPLFVAGCPPDGFSKTGQLWGNPLYDWEEHKKSGFSWWIKRIMTCFLMYDVVRIDHFRGFDEYYSIKYNSPDATKGEWRKGPGIEIFNAVFNAIGKREYIAEDLGFVTPSVKKLLEDTGFPGMKILEFAFDERDTGSANDYLPHNYPTNCVSYTATHDNQTVISWFSDISDAERQKVRNYLCDEYTPKEKINLPLISLCMMSRAKLCIIPLQDYMGCNDKARINTPSTTGNNWRWRVKKSALDEELSNTVRLITDTYGRENKMNKVV